MNFEQREGESSTELKVIFQGPWGSGHRKEALKGGEPSQTEQARMKLLQEKIIDSHDMYVQRRNNTNNPEIMEIWDYQFQE